MNNECVIIGGPLNGLKSGGYGRMEFDAQFVPESYKRMWLRAQANPVDELRMIVTRYHREYIDFNCGGLRLTGQVWLWEHLRSDDQQLMVLAMGHAIAAAMKPAERV